MEKSKQMDHYVFLCSADSLQTHVNNTASDFVIDLPRTYRLDGTWECALTEITFVSQFEHLTDRIYVCSDVIEDSYVKGTALPILRSLDVDTDEKVDLTFDSLYYFKVQSDQIRRITIFIRDSELRPIRFKVDRLYCTLHFRRRWVP